MIRRATTNDATQLSALAMKTFYDTFVGTCTDEDMQSFLKEYYNVEQTTIDLSGVDDYFFVYEENKKMIGYMRFKEGNDGFDELTKYKALELKRLYVVKDHHGKGVAQQLMNFYIDFAQQNQYNMLWLGVWEFNERAKAFYKKNGFIDTGYTHDFPIGNTPQTDVWYWRSI